MGEGSEKGAWAALEGAAAQGWSPEEERSRPGNPRLASFSLERSLRT